MRRSLKVNGFWRRLTSGIMTVVMLVTILPTAAYAALWDNTPNQNQEILERLTEFWGDDKTAQEAMELLRQYGLIDGDGNVLTDWSGEIAIQEESRPLTLAEAREMKEGSVTVNGRTCDLSELNESLDALEALGLFDGTAVVADWQLQVDGQTVAPSGLETALESWQVPETEAPETSETTEVEPAEPQQSGGATGPVEAGGILASIGAFFGIGVSAQAPAAPVVTVLGAPVDPDELLEVIAFLDQYGLLTEAGCVADWGLTLPGGARKTDLTELLTMLESGDYDPDMVLTVDGTPVTMADFKTMMDIQKELERIQSTYFPEGGVEWTEEELGNLYDLYLQLQENGITLYNTQGADKLVFPSGVNQNARVSMKLDKTEIKAGEGGTVTATFQSENANEGQEITFQLHIFSGSAGELVTETVQTVTLTGNAQTSVPIEVTKADTSWKNDDIWDGEKRFYVGVYGIQNALFENGTTSEVKAVSVKNDIDFGGVPSWSASKTLDGREQYWLRNLANSIKWELQTSGFKRDTYFGTGGKEDADALGTNSKYGNPYNGQFDQVTYYQYWAIKATLGDTTIVDQEAGYKDDINTLGLDWDTDHNYSSPNLKYYRSSSEEKANKLPLSGNVKSSDAIPKEKSGTISLTEDLKKRSELTITSSGKWQAPVGLNGANGWNNYFYFSKESGNATASLRVSLVDSQKPSVVSVSIPDNAAFSPQMMVPITVTFSEPVSSGSVQITANDRKLSAEEENTVSKTLTFLYPVQTVDNSFIKVSEISGATDLAGQKMETETRSDQKDGILITPVLLDAIPTVLTAEVGDLTYTPAEGGQPEKTTAKVAVTLDIPEGSLGQLISSAYFDGTNYICDSLAASIDGGKALIPLIQNDSTGAKPTKMTATVEIDAATLINQQNFVMEFYQITVDKETGNAITKGDLLFGRYAAFSVKKPIPLTGKNLSVSTPDGWLDTIYVNDPPEDAKLTLTGKVSGNGYTWSQTRWVAESYNSDGETPTETPVATVDSNGVIHPLKAGVVKIYLEAVNGNLEEYQGAEYRSAPVTLTIQEGAEPYLRIPESQITLRSGDNLALRWASNLAQKNSEYGAEGEGKKTTFTINIYGGTATTGKPEATYTATYDPKAPDGTITMGDGTTIPMWTKDESGALTPNQSFIIPGLDDTGSGYTITITARAAEGVPNVTETDRTFTAQTRVTVTARPVSVSLTRPDKLFQVNEGSLTIPYTLTSFDAEGAGGEFKLTITDNATGYKVLETTDYKQYGDTASGQFTIDLSKANIDDGFRTIYDVTLQAKNTAEPDWSRDSFTLYIYDKSALDILVQPVTRDSITTVDVNGDTVTMSNEEWIASLSQDEILALNRDIDLQAAISINYGDHAWGEASDRIRWAVENSDTAAVNYPQGAYYENIEGLPYSSYAPATEFLLSGKNDGKTVVEAIHDLAGSALSSSVEVTVETLKDKLYLFQFYPAAPNLSMTYTNGAGQTVNKTSDGKGRFAIYEASGIASDVYVKGTVDGEVYLGTVYQENLVSQEKDAVSLELYPLNSLELRKVATLPLYLKTPDGKDYNGTATVRVGVYRNGEYCPEALYALKSGDKATIPGTKDQTVTFEDGKATFYFDVTQFNTNNGANPITAADDIEFVVELRTPVIREGGKTPEEQEKKDGLPLQYYPILFSAIGTTNEEDAIRLGERVINLEQAPNRTVSYGDPKDKKTIEVLDESPFIARQVLYFSDKETGLSTNLKGKKGKVGPNADYPQQLLSTGVLWWGEVGADTDPNTKRALSYTDDRGNELAGQTVVNDRYPFASMPITTVTVPMNKTQLDYLGIGDLQGRGIQFHYTGKDGKEAKQETMPWSFFNALNLEQATDSDSLPQLLDNLAKISSSADTDGFDSFVNDFIGVGITLATQVGIDTPVLQMQLAPTGDPTVFRGMVYIGLNNMQNDNISGVDADTSRGYDTDYFPGFEQIKGIKKQGAEYGKTMGNQLALAGKTLAANVRQGYGTSKTGDNKYHYALNGSFETEVYYDFTANEWRMVVLNGGFQVGGGMGHEWTWNTQVGPVPVLAQLELGGAAIIDFNAAVNRQVMDNDYLTQLYIYAYLQAFGGIGFDYAVIALKLGLFGQIGLDAQLEWLNAIGQDAQFGWSVEVDGSVGIKFQAELLFISYEQILWSQPIEVYTGTGGKWDAINNYWEKVGSGTSDAGIIGPDGTPANLLMATGDGTGIYAANLEPKLLDRDYLSQYERTYDRSGPDGGFNLINAIGDLFTGGGEDSSISTEIIGNSYPQAAPVLSDDGEWLFYLDDMGDGSDATVVRVKAAPKSGDGYDAKSADILSNEGYGDSGLKAAGSGENAVAVWSRVTERPATTEAGSSVTADVQAGMMNSSEIMVAVRSSNGWKVSCLTGSKDEDGDFESSDGLADLAPVVATNGERILVAWRQVASSQTDAITTFDTKDYIMYAVSEDAGENWTDPQPIYNGTSGSVKGIEAAMLDTGEAAVVFTLQTGEHNTRSGDFNQEVVYAIVDEAEDKEKSGSDYEVTRYVQMTDDDAMDENPQITAVELNGKEVFVIGWSSTSGVDEAQEADIRLAAVDADGNRVSSFVDSLSSLIANTGVRVNADFRFSRNAETLDQLSILWKESSVTVEEETGEAREGTDEGADTTMANYDYLSGLRFRTDGGNISVTAAQRIAQMGASTVIDNFDAYVGEDGKLVSVLQGTYYDYEKPEKISDHRGRAALYGVSAW